MLNFLKFLGILTSKYSLLYERVFMKKELFFLSILAILAPRPSYAFGRFPDFLREMAEDMEAMDKAFESRARGWAQWDREQQPQGPGITIETDSEMVKISTPLEDIAPEAIDVSHENNRVIVKAPIKNGTLDIVIQARRHALLIDTCQKEYTERDTKEDTSESKVVLSGQSCMSQVIQAQVDLEKIKAEYSNKKLILSIPKKNLVLQQEKRQIPVTIPASADKEIIK